MLRSTLILPALLAVMAPLASAQENIGDQIKQVYDATKTAESEQDYSSIIRRCAALKKQTENNAERIQYLDNLMAWGLNKRGELYASQAIGAEDAANAAELDELALKDFEAAVAADPKRWRAIHNRGVSYALLGYSAEAEEDFSTVVQLNPKYANSWFNRGELRYESGRLADAKSDYAQVLQLSPNDVAAMRGHALCNTELGDAATAVATLSKAISLGATSELHVLRGKAHESLANWERAAGDYRRAVELDKNSVAAYHAAAWLMAACPTPAVRNVRLAVPVAERAMKLEQEQLQYVSSRTYDILGAAYATAGNPTKAVQHARAALERTKSPERRAAIEQRIQLYQQGKPYHISTATASRPATRQ